MHSAPVLTSFLMKLVPLPTDRLKRGTALPAKLKPAFPTSHLITTLILLYEPPTYSIRATFASLLNVLYVSSLIHELLRVH